MREEEEGEVSDGDPVEEEKQMRAPLPPLPDASIAVSHPHRKRVCFDDGKPTPHPPSPLLSSTLSTVFPPEVRPPPLAVPISRTSNGWKTVTVPTSSTSASPLSSQPSSAPPLSITPFRHYVTGAASPPLPDFHSLSLAYDFPFALDAWQQCCVSVLHLQHHLIVSAHTSAGKTTAAEYAIALALRQGRRALYCAPIKTLSNQKWREWNGSSAFGDVGLLTGDVSIAPSAPVLIMTTEVLRHALYSASSPLLNDVAVVIFDEVHYLGDLERGTVWEESLISLLSLHDLPVLCLSATIGNVTDLADWFSSLSQRPCHVVSTLHRPVPLLHYVFDAAQRTLVKVKDAQDRVLMTNVLVLREAEDASKAKPVASSEHSTSAPKRTKKAGGDLLSLLSLCIVREWTPVIVFSFSRRDCEQLCLSCSAMTLTTPHEQSLITSVFDAAMASLSPTDRQLPQITSLYPLLLKGLATHHSGLLPVLKELVEILFGEHLLKVLFATETFAIGLNLPARSVVFEGWRKFDGKERRLLKAGEYTQMSGRAGRRGIDRQGLCITLSSVSTSSNSSASLSSYSVEEIGGVLGGGQALVLSRFALSWTLLLHVGRLQSGALDMQDVIERSFKQWQVKKERPRQEDRLRVMEEQRRRLQEEVRGKEELLSSYTQLADAMEEQRMKARALMDDAGSASLLRWLQSGRVVWCAFRRRKPRLARDSDPSQAEWRSGAHSPSSLDRVQSVVDEVLDDQRRAESSDRTDAVSEEETVHFGWGIVVDFHKRHSPASYLVQLLLPVHSISSPSSPLLHLNPSPAFSGPSPPSAVSSDASIEVVSVSTSAIAAVSSLRLPVPDDLHSLPQRQAVYDSFLAVKRSNFDGGKGGTSPSSWTSLYPSSIHSSLPLLPPSDLLPASYHSRLSSLLSTLTALNDRLSAHPLSALIPHALSSLLAAFKQLPPLQRAVDVVQHALLQASPLHSYHSSLSLHMQVLVSLSYLTPSLQLTAKGRVAAEVDSVNPLLLTELIFSAFFAPLTPPLVCAALSCLLMGEERNTREDRERAALSAELRYLYTRIEEANAGLKKTVELVGVEWTAAVRCGLMAVVHGWSEGEAFDEVMRRGGGGVFEGSVIRCVRRLEELLQQLMEAARRIGSAELEKRFADASHSIRRGIIFAGSLYQ